MPRAADPEESQSLIHQVSVSDFLDCPLGPAVFLSQSLIHQVSVSDVEIIEQHERNQRKSQSLIHQVSVSDFITRDVMDTIEWVSIPYSSGLSFRYFYDYCDGGSHDTVSIPYSSGLSFRYWNMGNKIPAGLRQSQSLIHQVSVSDTEPNANAVKIYKERLNPLFIRSQFQMLKKPGMRKKKQGLNPLFIRSQFQIYLKIHFYAFFSWSQSLIHQVSVSD